MGFDTFVKNTHLFFINLLRTKWKIQKCVQLSKLHRHLLVNYGKQEDYLIIDMKKNGQVKIRPKYEYSIHLSQIKDRFENTDKKKKLTIKIGNGSPGGKYQGKGGLDFEKVLYEELTERKSTENTKIINCYLPIDDNTKIIHRDGTDTRRPIRFIFDKIYLKHNTPENIGDISIHNDSGTKYISVKTTKLVTYMNIGVTKYLTKEQIQNNSITDPLGCKLISILGINKEKFCYVFNNYYRKLPKPAELFNQGVIHLNKGTKFADDLYSLILQAISKDYWVFHKIDNTRHMYYINNKFSDLYPLSYNVTYGGNQDTRKIMCKCVNVIVMTKFLKLTFNIRHKYRKIYPSHIMCDYRYV